MKKVDEMECKWREERGVKILLPPTMTIKCMLSLGDGVVKARLHASRETLSFS